MNMIIFWVCAAILFIVIEAVGVGLASIWFALGAVCALIAALLGAPPWLQVTWFIVISVVTLIATRPLAKKYVNSRRQATNADRVIGTQCVVTERIDNMAETGAVKCDGKEWTARSQNGEILEKDQIVTVIEISGVKLIVTPKNDSM